MNVGVSIGVGVRVGVSVDVGVSVTVSVSVSSYIKILHIVIVSQLRIRLSGLPADRPMALELEHFFFDTVVNKLNFLS